MPEIKDLIKEAMDALPDGATPEKFAEVFAAVADKHRVASGKGSKSDPAAASAQTSDDTTEASTKTDETPESERAASDPAVDAPPAEEVALETDDALKEQIVQESMALAEALGTDLAGLTALLQERREQVLAALQGAAEDGTEAEEAEAMSKEAEAEAKLSAAETRSLRKQLSAEKDSKRKLSERLSQLEAQIGEHQIDLLIRDGVFLADERDELLELRREAPKAFERRLARAKEKPAVPTGSVYKGKPPAKDDKDDISDLEESQIESVTASLMRMSRYRHDREAARKRAVEQLRAAKKNKEQTARA